MVHRPAGMATDYSRHAVVSRVRRVRQSGGVGADHTGLLAAARDREIPGTRRGNRSGVTAIVRRASVRKGRAIAMQDKRKRMNYVELWAIVLFGVGILGLLLFLYR